MTESSQGGAEAVPSENQLDRLLSELRGVLEHPKPHAGYATDDNDNIITCILCTTVWMLK